MSRSVIGGAFSAVTRSRPVAQSPVPLAPQVSRYDGSVAALTGALYGGTMETDLEAMEAAGTIYAIVDALSSETAGVEWHLWRESASGKPEERTEITSHSFLDWVAQPNPATEGPEMREAGQQHVELTGEMWQVVVRRAGIVLESWMVPPHRMQVVRDPRKLVKGYVYLDPDGGRVPLEPGQVERIRVPNPASLWRGASPLSSVRLDIASARSAAAWSHNFFTNSAEPGGIIEIPPDIELSDPEFNRMRQRWNDSHRGLINAHRVAILERGKWIDRKYTMRDMEFVSLRGLSREVIREAWRFPVSLLGTTTDVNRAVAEAMDATYGKRLLVPRLKRWKAFYNRILRDWPGATGLVFDFESPVPSDRAMDMQELTARAQAASTLVSAGWDRAAVLAAVGLPDMPERIEVAPLPADPAPGPDADPSVFDMRLRRDAILAEVVEELEGKRAAEITAAASLSGELADVQEQWQAALDQTLARWQGEVLPEQYAEAVRKVREAIEAGDVAALGALTISSLAASDILAAELAALATAAARTMTDQAATQGVVEAAEIEDPIFGAATFAAMATATAGILAGGVALSAATTAARLAGMDSPMSADEIAQAVADHLDSLTDAQPRLHLGGSLWGASNAGRAEALRRLPAAKYYATEELDRNTCKPCEDIHGKAWDTLPEVLAQYPVKGYRKCEGGDRCRGTFIARWDNA